MKCRGNEFGNPKEEQSVIGFKDLEIQGDPTGQGNAGTATWRTETDREDELFVRLELPLVITGWIIFVITFGYLVYVGV